MPHGYKTCKECHELVAGPRTKECPKCGAAFGTRVTIATEDGEPVIHTEGGEATHKVFSYPTGYTFPADKEIQRIHIPAGSPPISLRLPEGETFPSDDTLLEWAANVRQELINVGIYVRNTGLKYWACKAVAKLGNFAPRGDEMQYVKLVLDGLPDITTREVPA